MKYEVLQGADAEAARLAGKKLEWWNVDTGRWEPKDDKFQCVRSQLYHLAPEPVPPKRVPLGPEDVKAGDMVRSIGETRGWSAVCGARKGGGPSKHDGIWLLGTNGTHTESWKGAMDNTEISRDGGKTWEPCSKEAR